MNRRTWAWARSALPFGLAALGMLSVATVTAADLLAQNTPAASRTRARVNGRVTDVGTGQPLEGVNVIIVGTPVTATTGADGRFVIASAPVGVFSIEAKRLGYGATQRANVQLRADSLTTLNFELNSNPLRLDAITTSASVDATSGRNATVSVDKLSQEDIPVAVTGSAAGMIQGKVAGVKITRSSGAPGSGVNVVLRTPIAGIEQGGAPPSPLYVVDGVFLNQTQSITTQDIESLDIASIEVLKGAAAAALYGSRAAAGVIAITTNRGKNLAFGTNQFTTRMEYGQDRFKGDLKKNRYHNFRQDAQGNWLNASNQPVARNLRATNQFNIMDQAYTVPTYDHAAQFFGAGSFNSQTATVQGNSASSNYTLSYTRTQSPGVLQYNDGYSRQTLRVNVDSRINEKLNMGASASHQRGRTDEVASSFTNFFRYDADINLRSIDPKPRTGFPYNIIPDSVSNAQHPVYSQYISDNVTKRARTNLNVNLAYRPWQWLSFTADAGYDRGDLNQENFQPRGIPLASNGNLVNSTGTYTILSQVTDGMQVSAGPTLTKAFGDLTVRLTQRGEIQRETNPQVESEGTQFTTEGVKSMSIAATKTVTQTYTDRRTIASLSNIGLSYADKYIINGLVRREGSSLFGRSARWNTYFGLSGGWLMDQESWFPFENFSLFKLRYSLGTAGSRPGFSDQYDALVSDGTGGISTGSRGNPFITPTLSREQELGLDITYKNRISGTFNYVSNVSSDVFNDIPTAAAAGYSVQVANVGQITGNTMEATLQGQILSNPNGLSWTVLATADRTRNIIAAYGRSCIFELPLYRCNGARVGETFTNRNVRDKAQLTPADRPFADQFDVNDDGYVVPVGAGNTWRDGIAKSLWGTTVNINGTPRAWGLPFPELDTLTNSAKVVRAGDFNPDMGFGLSNTIRYKALRVYFLMNGQIGGNIYNDGRQTFYASGDHKNVVQAGKPEETKKPVTYYSRLATQAWDEEFVESGTNLQLSELLVGYTLNAKQTPLLKRFGVSQMQIDLVGRNLGVWTKYSGLNVLGGTPFRRVDAIGYPITRTFTGAVSLTF
ncbi:MAG: SusC/RagA family TonB-linked outer membrane protein [Gemmatimonadota bacterium]